MADGFFSKQAPGDGLSGVRAAQTQINMKFSASSGKTDEQLESAEKHDDIPFDPRPLHIILSERKVLVFNAGAARQCIRRVFPSIKQSCKD
jgi:hypothetical protein